MNITCSACQSTFRVHDASVPDSGARGRCPGCSEWLLIRASGGGENGDALFHLPPMRLERDGGPDEDVFGLTPAGADGEAPGGPAEGPGSAPRRKGLRGWLSRLFGIGS